MKISTSLEALTHKYDIISSSETWWKESEIGLYNIHDAIPSRIPDTSSYYMSLVMYHMQCDYVSF